MTTGARPRAATTAAVRAAVTVAAATALPRTARAQSASAYNLDAYAYTAFGILAALVVAAGLWALSMRRRGRSGRRIALVLALAATVFVALLAVAIRVVPIYF